MKLCLVCDDDAIEAAVRASCPLPHTIQVFSSQGLVNEQRTLSAHGAAIVQAAAAADAVLIDWDFEAAPELNTLCFHVRRTLRGPVWMLCREGPGAMAACIAAGADDALGFPLYPSYLQAKILAYRRGIEAVRAAEPQAAMPGPADEAVAEQRFGPLRFDVRAHRFFVRDQEVDLTPREFALLSYLVAHADALVTRDQILDAVWGIDFDTGTNMVDVYMYFLRKKLEAHQLKEMIETVRGRGYRLVEPPPSAG